MQQLIFHLNIFLKIDSRTHSGVFKINAHIQLLLFVLLPPIPKYNVDDFVLRGAGRRRVSDYFAAVCTQLFHVQLCERGKGGGLQHVWMPEHVHLFRRHRYQSGPSASRVR